ncbi:MAG: tRNA (adenosine(37)-N6)-dimethylallyltransferase MiaA, partial [Clostridia bacterium]|nr:tRNA (adenosine(37)-N6)-dimethylallyltransferase MiaA [Clostridia bacterium]
MKKPQILIICGPTASGKSGLAVEVAKRLNGEVVSADSMQIYKKLQIGTAKPTIDEMEGIPHHMIDCVDPATAFSVSDYEEMALPIINDIISRGRLPIVCGGTGFYINSLLYSFSYGNSGGENVAKVRQ